MTMRKKIFELVSDYGTEAFKIGISGSEMDQVYKNSMDVVLVVYENVKKITMSLKNRTSAFQSRIELRNRCQFELEIVKFVGH